MLFFTRQAVYSLWRRFHAKISSSLAPSAKQQTPPVVLPALRRVILKWAYEVEARVVVVLVVALEDAPATATQHRDDRVA
jgi:hypothetical protein